VDWIICQVAHFCGHGNEPSGSVKSREFLDQLTDCQLLIRLVLHGVRFFFFFALLMHYNRPAVNVWIMALCDTSLYICGGCNTFAVCTMLRVTCYNEQCRKLFVAPGKLHHLGRSISFKPCLQLSPNCQ